METIVTRDGDAINVEWFTRWYGRLFSLPLLAGSLYFFYYVFLALKDEPDDWSDNLSGILVFVALGLMVGLPGLMVATFRYFVVVDKAHRQVSVTRRFGPVKFRRLRRLSDFNFISITDDGDSKGTMFGVNLCGNRGSNPVVLSSFTKRRPADDFARALGNALTFPVRDLVDTEPYDPDLDADTQAEDVRLSAVRSRGGCTRQA
jgi:hypothetical protein